MRIFETIKETSKRIALWPGSTSPPAGGTDISPKWWPACGRRGTKSTTSATRPTAAPASIGPTSTRTPPHGPTPSTPKASTTPSRRPHLGRHLRPRPSLRPQRAHRSRLDGRRRQARHRLHPRNGRTRAHVQALRRRRGKSGGVGGKTAIE